ncbi:MAG: polysaccharide lyase [Gammaproteobacteria bacterium]|nr:polysaccharide lyase [Gammaproteobacteria bacterium]MBU1492127.1 polysaccharide lyase [Gammaproteobacteria bacterium]MBU2067327.1 polysaccharide lyase [Gammaproteobacteria bacterium]MBU2158469.1 polysaccharide lyase [Gammaproteobacteria bacterium]MBU2216852.1 polysaccharide lyase [Gammaproteobacteria bacterium]
MPLKAPLALATLLLLSQLPAQATESIWASQANPLVSGPADYQALSCPKKPPAPYTGHLQLQSKYDQSDSSKSTLVKQSRDTTKIGDLIKGYIGGLATGANQFQRAKNAEQAHLALACIDQWLTAWAKGGALRNPDASGTGVASRKWALAAISSTLLKTQALSGGAFQLNAVQRGWLQQLAEQVIAEHQPRHRADFAYFNNHDYWAGWAVAATGMLLNRDDFLAWADTNLRRAFAQATPSASADARYLPLEVARAHLAADYSNYAMVPLVLLAEAAEHNGRPLNAEERQKLQQLANFTARAVLEPKGLPELDGKKQKKVGSHKMIWLIPFLNRYPEHTWARALYDDQDGEVDNYSQIGGRLKPLYSRFE